MIPIAIAHLREWPIGVQFHPNGQFLLVHWKNAIEVRVAATGEKVWGLAFRSQVNGAAYAEGGRSVLVACDGSLWRTQQEEKVTLDAAFSLFGTSADGRLAILQREDRSFAILDLETLQAGPPFGTAKLASIEGAVSNDGQHVLLGTPAEMIEGRYTAPPRSAWMLRAESPFALHPNGNLVVHRDSFDLHRVCVLDWNTRTLQKSSPPRKDGLVHDVGFSTDGSRFHVSGAHGADLHSLDGTLDAGTLSHTGFGKARTSVTRGAFSPDGSLFATLTNGHDLFVWDLPR